MRPRSLTREAPSDRLRSRSLTRDEASDRLWPRSLAQAGRPRRGDLGPVVAEELGSRGGLIYGGVALGLILLCFSRLPTIQASAAMYWLARWSIIGTAVVGCSRRDQKNLEGRRAIINACINREG